MFLRYSSLFGLVATLASGMATAQEATFPSQTEVEVVPGRYIVKTAPGFVTSALSAEALNANIRIVDTLPLVGAHIIEVQGQPDFEALAARALQISGVEYIERDFVVRADAQPNDGDYAQQWAFPKISAPRAWDTRTNSEDRLVAVIDTGVDYRHPDIVANMWTNPGETPGNNVDDDGNGIVDDVFGANFVPDMATGDPMDDHRHGTHVAGTVGAVSHNNLGVAGTNWKTKLMAVKFLDANGRGTISNAIRAIEYATRMKAHIMNNSWGGGPFSPTLERAIRDANDAGILFVAAAGNSNTDNDAAPHYPSSYDVPNVLAIMATDQSDAKAGFSSFGATTVDVGAPGVDIRSTTPAGNYDNFNGTSMATPHVAGAAALVWAEHPSLSHIELKQRLMDTAEVIPALSGRSVTGARIDLAASIEREEGNNGCQSRQHVHVAYEEFFWSDNKTVDQNDNLLSVNFELPEPMVVDIAAHGSAKRTKGSGNTPVRTGVYSDAPPNIMWTGSYRRGNFLTSNDHRILSSDFSIALPAGKHTIYWKLWITNATLQFDSGTLTVRGIPCSMGGKLAPAATIQAADVTQSDPSPQPRMEELGIDDQGVSTTKSN